MKRSNSTSMISELLQSGMVGVSMEERRGDGSGIGLRGKRNLSTSNASLPGDLAISLPWASPIRRQPLSSPLPLMRINSPTSRQHRVEQLRKEESVDERIREVEQDREVTSQIHLNQSCFDMKLDDDELRQPDMMEALPCPIATTITTPFISPSSPVFPSRVRSRSLTPTSPSSARTFTTYRRSLSPVPMRPSSLVFEPRKRKRNSDNEEMDISPTQPHPPAKRAVFASPLTNSPCISPLSTSAPINLITHGDDPRPAFETHHPPGIQFGPLLSPSHFIPRPLPGGFYEPVPAFPNTRKRVGIPGDLTLNSHAPPLESAFLPFNQQCSDSHQNPRTHVTLPDPFNSLPSSFHPVTTIS